MSRRRFIWSVEENRLVEVGGEWTDAPRRAQTPTEELTYGGMRATDGADISSRKKHREYMKHHNVALASDFKETWAKAGEERAKFYRGESRDTKLREQIGRAMEQRRKK